MRDQPLKTPLAKLVKENDEFQQKVDLYKTDESDGLQSSLRAARSSAFRD